MSEPKFPVGWDADRVKRLIDQYEEMSEDEMTAEDEAAFAKSPGETVLKVPDELLPAIRQLLTRHKNSGPIAPAI